MTCFPQTTWLRRHAMVLIFSVAYVLLALLVVEQNRTILVQQQLIRQLFHDSLELNAMRLRDARAHSP
ncbi:MAG TPA: hypothetical protein VFA60_04345 [Terriglobales bacterium]|nr:hypothetical protein [Terriglobales bacterium]